jgi:hypothetical protein
MVCVQLTKLGFWVTHVDGVGYDLILNTEHGSVSVQVKGSSVVRNGYCLWSADKHGAANNVGRNNHSRVAKRALTPRDADLLALFHHGTETTVFLPIEHGMKARIALPQHQVQQADIEQSLSYALQRIFR